MTVKFPRGVRALDLKRFGSRAAHFAGRPRARKAVIWVASILVGVGVLGGLVAPPLLRDRLARELSTALRREVSIRQIRINPYALSASVRGLAVKERQGAATAASFDELYVNLELLSLFYRGLVLKEVRLVKPYLRLVRNEDLTYNFADIVEELAKPPADPRPRKAAGAPRFSLNNIEVIDGRIDFDDRPEGVAHVVSAIRLGVPFVSNIPYYADVKVEPVFSALVNGSRLEIRGETTPFKEPRESTIEFGIENLRVPTYVEYSPLPLNFEVPSGGIQARLRASFRMSRDQPAVLSISGDVMLKELVLQEKKGEPIFRLPALGVAIDSLEPFANRAALRSVIVQGPELRVVRDREGRLNLGSLIGAPPGEKARPTETEKKPFGYRIDEIQLEDGKLMFADRAAARPFEKRLEKIRLSVRGLTTEPQKRALVELSFRSDADERFEQTGSLQLNPLAAEGKFSLARLQLKALQPYVEAAAGLAVRDGLLDVSSAFSAGRLDEKWDAKLAGLEASLRSLHLDLPGQKQPFCRLGRLNVKETQLDLGKKSLVVGAIEAHDGSGFVHRAESGAIAYGQAAGAQPGESSAKAAAKASPPWTIEAKRLALDRFRVVFEDRALAPPARWLVSELSARASNLSTARNAVARASLRAKVNERGLVGLTGTAALNPLTARLDIEAQGLALLPLQPYLADRVNFSLAGGTLGVKGRFTLESDAGGSRRTSFEGRLTAADFASVEKGGAELLRWKSLALDGVRLAMEPVRLHVADIALADFYSRVIIGADGKINLQELVARRDEESPERPEASEAPAETKQPQPPPARITIGRIRLSGGNVNFSDFFVKPNYSANLTELAGEVSELTPESPGQVQLRARIDSAAPVEIGGKINPLGSDLFLDLKAKADDIELSPLTPYSAKYVGYGIEKGKLSFDARYRVENRKLSAENTIVLKQLTFGERMESPTATKLPVLLAVALLKDRNGVIDVNLPISGSLDDPQFSVGGIVLRLFLNIISKAVTAPFALLSAAFGRGEELSYVEFEPGRASLARAAAARLQTLATAMSERPGLKLEIRGMVDPARDREGLKRVSLERKVKAQKRKELQAKGVAPALDDVMVESGEYPRLLAAAYREEDFPKPRNFLGLPKSLPVPEMESLMLQHAPVGEAELRRLATERAQAVRDYLLGTGKVSLDRLFIVSSAAQAEATEAKGSRVEFSLR